ncbi:MAG TPA: carbohydrate ABC transporter permease [Chloroflexota bacterium]|nr:carbohydrate ABC transporter permease [Chloroflexota bacterium]
MATAAASVTASRRVRAERWVRRGVMILAGLFFALWTLGPLYWIIATSLKTELQVYREPTFFPSTVTFDNYQKILLQTNFLLYIRNSIEVAVVTTLLSMTFGSAAAYAISRLHFTGRRLIARSIVVSYLVPASLLFISLFEVLTELHLTDHLAGLMVVYLSFTLPFCTWLMIGYFRAIPVELEEAALVDGCTRLRALVSIILPLTLPALVVVTLFSFTQSWNEFLYALVFISSDSNKTFTVGLIGLIQGDTLPWGLMMAAATLGLIPPLIIYVVSQRWVVSGLAAGSIKG